jgi:translin
MKLKEIFTKIIKNLDEIDNNREEILKISRQMIRNCSVAIKSIHRKEYNIYQEKIDEIKLNHTKLLEIVEQNPHDFSRYLKTPEQEYTEAICLHAIINKLDLPDPTTYKISDVNYLLGLADVVGELRRFILDKIRIGEIDDLDQILDDMEDIYSHLFSLDYPKGITQDLRRKTDVARGIIEKTRGEISLIIQMNQLKKHLNRNKLSD